MTKYHINSKGVSAPCKAKNGKCPFGGEESHYETQQEAQAAADEQNAKEFGKLHMRKHFGYNDQLELANTMTKHSLASLDGTASTSTEHNNLRAERANFEKQNGAFELFNILDKGGEVEDVENKLREYFPTKDSFGNTNKKREKAIKLAAANIDELNGIGMMSEDEYKIKTHMENFNIERTSEKVFSEANPPEKKLNKKDIVQIQEYFEAIAKNPERATDLFEAKEFYERHSEPLDNSPQALKAQIVAFELAKEYNENKILKNTFSENEDKIVAKLSSKIEQFLS